MSEKNPSVCGEISPSMAYMKTEAAANVDDVSDDEARKNLGAGAHGMGRIIVLVLILLLVGALSLVGYAYSGFLQPDVQTVTQPVDLDVE